MVPSFPVPAAGSLPFLPNECFRSWKPCARMGARRPGGATVFVDAFNSNSSPKWYNTDCLGIDLGISVLMAENLRTGLIWSTFMSNPECANAMQLAGSIRAKPESMNPEARTFKSTRPSRSADVAQN